MLVLFSKCARIAQLVEQRPLKAKVSGPIPDAGTKICETNFVPNNARNTNIGGAEISADVAELEDALDLGSSGVIRGGSTPSIRTRQNLRGKFFSFKS